MVRAFEGGNIIELAGFDATTRVLDLPSQDLKCLHFATSGRASDAPQVAQLRTRGGGNPSVWSSFAVRANELP